MHAWLEVIYTVYNCCIYTSLLTFIFLIQFVYRRAKQLLQLPSANKHCFREQLNEYFKQTSQSLRIHNHCDAEERDEAEAKTNGVFQHTIILFGAVFSKEGLSFERRTKLHCKYSKYWNRTGENLVSEQKNEMEKE